MISASKRSCPHASGCTRACPIGAQVLASSIKAHVEGIEKKSRKRRMVYDSSSSSGEKIALRE